LDLVAATSSTVEARVVNPHRVRALAISGAKRSVALPDVPTLRKEMDKWAEAVKISGASLD
jgi:tripartite-type tricarboxylate transporter receptor subunit TctC